MKNNHKELIKSFILLFLLIFNISLSIIGVELLKLQPAIVLKLKIISLITAFILYYIFLAILIVRKSIFEKFFYFNLMISYQIIFFLRYRFNECIFLALGICYDIYYLFGLNIYLRFSIYIVCILLLLKTIKRIIKLKSKTPLYIKNKIRKISRLNPQTIMDKILPEYFIASGIDCALNPAASCGVFTRHYKLILDEKTEEPKQISPAATFNITIIRKGGLGDILMTLPAVRGLKDKYPNAIINYVVHGNQFEALIPAQFIDNIITAQNIFKFFFTLRKSNLIIDLENTVENETDKPAIDLFCSLLNVQPKSKTMEYNMPIKYIKWADNFFIKNNINAEQPIIGIQVGSGSPARSWDFENIKHLAQLLQKKNYYVVLIGQDKEYTIKGVSHDIISALGETSILQAAALIKKCTIFVCPDSGLLHLAAFLKAPTIALFGVISPHMRTTYYPYCRPVFNNLECSPCNDHSQPPKCINDIKFNCMKSITAEQVLVEIENYIHELKNKL